VGTGIRRNPEEFRGIQSKYRNSCLTGIPAKIPVTVAKNRNSCNHLQNHVPVKKFLRKTQEKKKSSGILAGTGFLVQIINS
jgi:hypothetical protein